MRLDNRMSHCGRNCILKQINVSIYSKSFPVCDKRRNLNHWRPCSLCWSSHFSELFPSHIHRQVGIYPCSQMQAHFHRQMARNVFKLFKYDKICGESKTVLIHQNVFKCFRSGNSLTMANNNALSDTFIRKLTSSAKLCFGMFTGNCTLREHCAKGFKAKLFTERWMQTSIWS